ncbi:alpha-amylase family glycosyl hydrolase [Rhodohalobacter sp. 8-1]|uniref:alpha-amylase family glycosyl hydrolase n=1 Tax=Rhodohalobacter sp. 8-1 TaxID=3131972 RepID=UPI0030EE5547
MNYKYSLRTIVTTLILLFIPLSLFGQAIKTDPAFPAEDKPLTIVFDVSETQNNDLQGYSGSVYAHTGVILNEADKNSGSWSYVIADWPVNISRAQLTSLGNDQWELQIDDIREYYEIPDSEGEVLQLAFVLRNSDGSLQTEDLFVDLFDDELQVRFTSPSIVGLNPFFADDGQSINFEIAGSSELGTLSSITLLQGDTEIVSVSDTDMLSTTYVVTGSGRTDFYAVAEDQQGTTASDTLSIIIKPDVVRLARPQGIEDGITYHASDTDKVTLSFFAPGKEFAYVIGSFSDWEVQDEYYMNLDEASADSAHFWIEIDGLQPGVQHTFQYLIDGELRVADLYSELVLDPDFDQYIPETIYPDMPEYPAGLTEEMVSVIETGQTDYQWQVPDFQRPAKEELVIYELLLRDFLEESSFSTLRDTLSYLENLGINAIELMPVSQFDGNISWGYNPTFHGALEKSYGSRQAFREFVDEAHQRGMAVLLDVVYNHAHDKSPLVRMFGTNSSENPLLGPGHAYNVFFHLNHDNSYIKYWLDRMNRHWLEEYNIDGYRFDLSKGFASNVDNQSLLDGRNEQRITNLKRMADEIWSYDPEAYVILEHFAANSEEIELSDYGMMLWGNHNHNYSQASMGYTQESNFSGIHFANRGWSNPHLVGYMESHDEQWIMLKNRKFGNSDTEYDVTDFRTAIDRQKLTGSFFLTIPGPKMLWQFGELGYGWGEGECLKPGGSGSGDCTPSDPGRTDEKPIRWEYADNSVRYNLYRTWSELLRLRESSPVFTSAETQFSSSLSGEIKSLELLHNDMNAVIVGNFGVFGQSASITLPETGTWYDFVSGTELNATETNQSFEMAPGEVRIYTSQEIPASEEGVFVSNEEIAGADIPENFRLRPNYPNPFNPTTTISYDIPQASPVQLNVYDALGRQVATLVQRENHPAGTFTVTFDASQLSSGIYFTRLESQGLTRIQKMSLIK